jgi:hypothetical protein
MKLEQKMKHPLAGVKYSQKQMRVERKTRQEWMMVKVVSNLEKMKVHFEKIRDRQEGMTAEMKARQD